MINSAPLSFYTFQFKVFIQCAMDHSDYYDPFLSMLLGDDETAEEESGGQGSGSSAA